MPAEKYVRQGETAPNLHPLPTTSRAVALEHTPRHLWQTWYALPKEPLMITASFAEKPADETYQLDALLSTAVRRSIPAPWHFPEQEPRIIPLPLELLGIVPGPAQRQPLRLPVWASTPLITKGQHRVALAIGHAQTVRELLGHLRELDGVTVRWSVTLLPLSHAEAIETIRHARPMPERTERFTPPYWHDWLGAAHG